MTRSRCSLFQAFQKGIDTAVNLFLVALGHLTDQLVATLYLLLVRRL